MGSGASQLVADLFRRESAHLVAALVRLLGPSRLALAEDVVHDALVTAMHAWQLGAPADPAAWILQVARRRAIDVLRRERRHAPPDDDGAALEGAVDLVLSPEADAANQLALMFAVCDDELAAETHVTLILRLLCGLSPAEIARGFLVDVATIDRRLHRGRARLQAPGALDAAGADQVAARQPSIERALYLLFSEGYHGSDPDLPLLPALCADAIRLAELLLTADGVAPAGVHALAALFCFHAARVDARVDGDGVLLPLADQDRRRWSRPLIERGVCHLGASAGGAPTRWHLEAGIAFEHTRAPSLAATDWERIVGLYDLLVAMAPGPIVALNRGLAIAELRGLDAGRDALVALADEPRLARYSFYWAGRADLERRAGRADLARELYDRAIALARSGAERTSYQRRRDRLA
jgi:RNA polymerase sigma-70 factor (ECF subfamily)